MDQQTRGLRTEHLHFLKPKLKRLAPQKTSANQSCFIFPKFLGKDSRALRKIPCIFKRPFFMGKNLNFDKNKQFP